MGNPPPMPLPPLQPPDPQELVASLLAMTAMAQGQPSPTGQPPRYILGPQGEVLEMRTPQTVTERLQAQQLLGIGMTENPAGRKASGQAPPKQESVSDGGGGSREVVRESRK